MPEDGARKGDRATDRLVNLFQQMGWTLKSRTDVDAETPEGEDRTIGYGLDAYLTYDDPHSRHTHGVLLESKAYDWENVTPKRVKEWFKTLLEKVDKAPESETFRETHNLGDEATITNTGILAIWADGKFSAEDFNEYVDRIDIPHKWDVSKIAIFGNEDLRRLANIERDYQQRKLEHEENLKIFYPDLTDEDGGRVDTITFNYMMSDYIFANVEEEDIAIVYYFGEMKFESLLFMYKALRNYQMISNNDQLKILSPNRGISSEPAEEEFKREFSEGQSSIDIEFESLENYADLSHYDNP